MRVDSGPGNGSIAASYRQMNQFGAGWTGVIERNRAADTGSTSGAVS